jgi:hypothetical protein
MSWDQRFFEPGSWCRVESRWSTLRDAAEYITELPKAEHDADEWQAAMQALLLVAEHDGPTMFARHRYHEGVEPLKDRSVRCSNECQSLDRAAH